MKKNIMVGILTLISMLIGSSPQVFAELIFRGGYLVKMLPTSGGYNEFLKTRYGATNPQLSGTALSAAFKSRASNWSIGLEMDDLSGDINYTTLNGDQQQNKMGLKNTMLFLAFYPRITPNLEIDLGYGSGKLTRKFYGYQSNYIVTSNISGQAGAQETSTTGSNMMIQVLYRIIGNKFRIEAGARYSKSKHKIPDDDLRPGYDEKGIPTAMDFDLG
ncbi:MAG: hypothetical protein VX003_14645, partial [SAR324 cluster bacterium]|nr:hypothetical protein [SAR324 cluster bacterium]